LEAILALEKAMQILPKGAKAPYYLGNLFYDKKNYEKSIELWEKSAMKDRSFPTVFRNSAIGFYNKKKSPEAKEEAYDYMQTAFMLDRLDARALLEFDQLKKRINHEVFDRLGFLEGHMETTQKRDDL